MALSSGGDKFALFGVVFGVAIMFALYTPPKIDFRDYPKGDARKQAFFDYMAPLVEQRNMEILITRKRLIAMRQRDELTWWGQHWLGMVAKEYGIEPFDAKNDEHWDLLLRRVDVVPVSLALVQAAKESAWGTSRFAREGNNFFGHWCYVKGCGLVPKRRAEGRVHEVAVFESAEQSVERYIHNLNTHRAYRALRKLRQSLRDRNSPVTGVALAAGLLQYSERGERYVQEVRRMIINNDLPHFDGTE